MAYPFLLVATNGYLLGREYFETIGLRRSKPSEIKRRTKLNAENRRRGTYGNGDKLDVSHKQGGGTKLEAQAKNRARNRGKAKG